MQRKDITGFVLAGGRSRRMGKDKAGIPWESGTLLTHAVGVLKQVASAVFIVGSSQVENPPAAVLPDKYPSGGPLGGIHTALTDAKTDWNLILAVDLPLATPALLNFIAQKCNDNLYIAIVPRVGRRLQPLCAAYHRNLLPEIETAIREDDLSIHRLLERLNAGIMSKNTGIVRVIEEQEIIAHALRPEMLENVNTPEDLKRARSIAKNLHV